MIRASRRYWRWLSKQRFQVVPLIILLAVFLLCIPAAVLLRPPLTGVAFSINAPPPQSELRNFYGIEQNAFGPFRWAKPDASILVPLTAPGQYRITLTLQDSPAAPAGRAVTVMAGDAAATLHLSTTPQDYVITTRAEPLDWARQPTPGLVIVLHSEPFSPSGDPRALGPIVARISVAPVAPGAPEWTGIAGWALALALVLLSLWHVGVRGLPAAILGLTGAAALTGLAALASTTFLRLVALPALLSLPFTLSVCGALACVEVVGQAARTVPGGHPAASAASAPPTVRRWRHAVLLPPLLVAAALRLGDLKALSLWLDEGATVHFAGLSWWRVLGLDGAYDLHPPLYYALVKLAELLVGEATAGRLVSAVAGTLTVAVVYALVALPLGWRAGLAASTLLALAPLHLWYSQEGRMYALGTLCVALAALALVGFDRDCDRPRAGRWWAVLFAAATLAGAYTVYSALYTLVPLALPLLWVCWRAGRRAISLVAATLVAAIGYLPWVPQVLATTRGITANGNVLTGRTEILAATPDAVWGSILSVSGVGGTLRIYSNSRPFFLERWPLGEGVFLFLSVLVLLLGMVVLVRRSGLLAGIAACFLVGTVVVAVLVSVLSPGYADRTILAGVLGWAVLGGALLGAARPRWLLAAGTIGIVALLILSLSTDTILRSSASKQQYRDLIDDAATVAASGYPIVPLGSWMPAFVEAYAPTLPTTPIVGDHGLVVLPQRDGTSVGALWLAYADNGWDDIGAVRQQLEALGYRRYLHKYYPRPLYLDLYALPTTSLGEQIAVDTSFAQWQRVGATSIDVADGPALHLPPGGNADDGASLDVAVTLQSVVTLGIDARLASGSGSFTAALTCLAAGGSRIEQESNETAANLPRDGAWHTLRVTTLCPSGTAIVRLRLANATAQPIEFRAPTLSIIPLR